MEKILVIDDDEGMRRLLNIVFRRAGYTVTTLSSIKDADYAIEQFNPDVILTDHTFPSDEEQGLSLAMRLKERGLKVVLMSGNLEIGDKALENDLPYIQKPFMAKALIATLEEVYNA